MSRGPQCQGGLSGGLSVRLRGPQCQTLFLVSRPILGGLSVKGASVSDFVFGFTADPRGPQCQTLFLVSRPIQQLIFAHNFFQT